MFYDTKALCKIWRELIFCFKNDKNLVNFDLSTKNSKKFALWSLLCKVFWPTKYREVYFMTLKSHAKFEEKLTCGLENDMRNLANFHQKTWKCQNWYFHGILLPKVENLCCKLTEKLYVMTLKNDVMKNLKRNWRVVSKLT